MSAARRFFFDVVYHNESTESIFADSFEKADAIMDALKKNVSVKYFLCNEIMHVRSFSVVVMHNTSKAV